MTMNDQQCRTVADFQAAFPIGQDFHTGLWGWRRVLGSLNLNACRFKTEMEAVVDRGMHYDRWVKNPSDFSR